MIVSHQIFQIIFIEIVFIDVRRFPSDVNTEAYVTLATNTQYCHGAIALGQSLRNTGTGRRLVVMVTNQVSTEMRSVSKFAKSLRRPTMETDAQ